MKALFVTLFLSHSLIASGDEADHRAGTKAAWQQFGISDSTTENDRQVVIRDAFVGSIGSKLIVAGGADQGGTLQHSIWIATATDDSRALAWSRAAIELSEGRAGGSTVSTSIGVLLIGGRTAQSESRDVVLIRQDEARGALEFASIATLPRALGRGDAAAIGDSLYVLALGSEAQSAASLHRLGFLSETDSWVDLTPPPWQASGDETVQLVVQNNGLDDKLYAILDRHEVWMFDPVAKSSALAWQRRSDVPGSENAAHAEYSASAFGQSHILMLSAQASNDGTVLSYNTITNAWTSYSSEQSPVGGSSVGQSHALSWNGKVLLTTDIAPNSVDSGLWVASINGPQSNFGWQNMAVLSVYLSSMVLVGVYFVFKNNSTDDYFRGGQNIPWWAAACSIYATMLSSLTYVALPALIYRTDWLIYIGMLMILVVAPLAIYVAMPFFRQIDATSAYEYLSKRFNMPVRLFASALFTLFHIGRMGIVLALTALALAAVTPLDAWQSVLIMAVLSLIYCTLGGIEAVIWTDTIQTVVLLIGAAICFAIIVGSIDGGFAGFIERGMADNKFRLADFDFSASSFTKLSIWVIILGGIGQNISSYTADQAVVQRYMTTKDEKAAAKAIWTNGILAVPGALLFFCIGTGLYAFYQSQPEKLDPTIRIDQIFPTFISNELPMGIAGLIVAGIFAAAQSTVSTSMNSIATTIVTDFMRPFNACQSDKSYLNWARFLTFFMGVLGTLTGLLFISPEIRSLMEEYFKVIGMFMGTLGGLFVLGITTTRANGWGAMTGIFAGVALMVATWLMQWADGYLFATIGIVTCLLVGYLASYVLPPDKQDFSGLTIYTMKP